MLQQLDCGPDIEIALRCFESTVLAELGYGLNFTAEWQTGEAVVSTRYYRYLDHQGFVQAEYAQMERLVFPGSTLLAFAHGEALSATQRQHIKRLLRHVLGLYLEGKPIKSREMMEKAVLPR